MWYHSKALGELKSAIIEFNTFEFFKNIFWGTERQKRVLVTVISQKLFFPTVIADFLPGLEFPTIYYPWILNIVKRVGRFSTFKNRRILSIE